MKKPDIIIDAKDVKFTDIDEGASAEDFAADNDDEKLRFLLKRKKAKRILSDNHKLQEILFKAKKISGALSHLPFVSYIFKCIAEMCDLLTDYSKGEYKSLPVATIISILASIIYLVTPIDLMPDVLPLVGAVDDAAILYIIKKSAENDIKAYRKWKKTQVSEEEEDFEISQ